MAVSRRKQHRRWKGIKWIDSPFSRHYKRRVALAKFQCRVILMQSLTQIIVINATSTDTPGGKIRKKIALADIYIKTMYSVLKTMKQAFDSRNNTR